MTAARPERAALFAGEFGVGAVAASAEEVRAAADVDAVDLCVPTSLHAPLAIKAARAASTSWTRGDRERHDAALWGDTEIAPPLAIVDPEPSTALGFVGRRRNTLTPPGPGLGEEVNVARSLQTGLV